uniref:Glutathione synthase n=1 Tax=Romanomermis culicivorax TaxID=13658 RepID=A0A915IWG1_ROMCU
MPKRYRSLVLDFSPNLIQAVAEDCKDWAQVNGICMRLPDHKDKSDLTQILPFTLAPSLTPKKLFNEAYDVQKGFNELYHRLAFDGDFIETSLVNVIKNDQFTRKLFEIYKRVYIEENCLDRIQSNVLTIQRSDYMFHKDDSYIVREYGSKIDGIKESTAHHYVLKQVEVNNIAAGGAGLADRVTKMHRRTFQQWLECKAGMISRIPDNRSLELVSTALAEAWFSYNVPNAILLVVIEPLNQNAMDQRMVEHEFSLLTSACVRRMTLPEISIYGKVDHERVFFSLLYYYYCNYYC